ncbi:hypothetical protein ACEPAF_2133 [Sanghuangporus sanghuang]
MFVRGEARRIERLGLEKKRTREIEEERDERAEKRIRKDTERDEKRDEEERRLAGLPLVYVPTELVELNVKQLTDQLKKLRKMDTSLPAVSTIKKKDDKIVAALCALVRKNLCTVDSIPEHYRSIVTSRRPLPQ